MEKIKEIELLIRSGQGTEARRRLRALTASKVARADLLGVANLCRRANLPLLALRLLNPLVRPTGKRTNDSTAEERAEYAAALTFVGATEEAIGILRTVDSRSTPQALLFQSFALFSEWNYAAAISVLERYLRNGVLTDYQRIVGQVNLAAAFVHEHQTESAGELLRELDLRTQKEGFDLLRGNVLELMAQNLIVEGRWGEAEKQLGLADRRLEQTDGLDRFFVHKWMAVVRLLKEKGARSTLIGLERIRKEAMKREHWESVRDCDRYQAIVQRDQTLFSFLYFGTPYEGFRHRLISEFNSDEPLPETYLWRFEGAENDAPVLDVKQGKWSVDRSRLKPEQLLHRLLVALTFDFYRPSRVAVLHHRLYPQEYYHPISSPPKVHEAVRRLKILV